MSLMRQQLPSRSLDGAAVRPPTTDTEALDRRGCNGSMLSKKGMRISPNSDSALPAL
jgi:hypothetical protein